MYFFDMFYNVATRFFTSFTHVFHKKRKGQEVQKSECFISLPILISNQSKLSISSALYKKNAL